MSGESQVEKLQERLEDLYAEAAYIEEEIADIEAKLTELGYEDNDNRTVSFEGDIDLDEDYPFDEDDFDDDDDDDESEEL